MANYWSLVERKAKIRLWNPKTGQALGTLVGHRDTVGAIALSPDGRKLASASDDDTARLWDLRTQTELHTLEPYANRVTAIAFSNDGSRVATGTEGGAIDVWNVATGQAEMRNELLDAVQGLAFSPDGRMLVAGDRGGAVQFLPYEETHSWRFSRSVEWGGCVTRWSYCWRGNRRDRGAARDSRKSGRPARSPRTTWSGATAPALRFFARWRVLRRCV